VLSALDLRGCAAPPTEIVLNGASALALARVLGTGGVLPILPVAAEWCAPLAWPPAWSLAWQEHGGRVVHAWHDLVLHRELALPLRCLLTAEVVAQRQTSAGALTVVRYVAADDEGPLWTTHAGVLWRGLATVDGGVLREPEFDGRTPDTMNVEVSVPADLAHRYSEASGIWNPVHTDVAAARAAGLDGPILHGSATMGLALTPLQERAGTARLTRVSVRFHDPVLPPDVLTVAITGATPTLSADVLRGDGRLVARLRASYLPLGQGEPS
jgi:acyl dehydratase